MNSNTFDQIEHYFFIQKLFIKKDKNFFNGRKIYARVVTASGLMVNE